MRFYRYGCSSDDDDDIDRTMGARSPMTRLDDADRDVGRVVAHTRVRSILFLL